MRPVANLSRPGRNGHRGVRGFSLIEVMVALLMFSFGILGLVGIQARAVQFSNSAEDQNKAALLASNIKAVMAGLQTTILAPATVTTWQTQVAAVGNGGLPNGVGTITPTGNTAVVKITWRSTNVVANSANATNQYVTTFVLP